MTTTIIIALSFITGFIICSILSWKIHRRHKQAWQDEYRRLMGGIGQALCSLNAKGEGIVTCSRNAIKILRDIYNGDK